MSNGSDEWADKFVTRLAEKQKTTVDANALLMQKQAMIRAEAPDLWESLRHEISERARRVNVLTNAEHFRSSLVVQGLMDHTLDSPAGHLLLVFRAEVPIIKYIFTEAPQNATDEPEAVEGKLRFQVFDESVWFVGRDRTRVSVSQAAEYFLEMHS